MTKTPEQMAEEFFENWQPEKPKYIRPKARQYALEKVTECFLAGYQAAKELYAAKLKEANDTVAGMADECEGLKTIIYDHDETNLLTPAQWISVKERLPVFRQYNQNDESGYTEDVLMCFVWGRIRINNFEKVYGVVTTGCGNNLNEVTHWMPLPSVEGLKHED